MEVPFVNLQNYGDYYGGYGPVVVDPPPKEPEAPTPEPTPTTFSQKSPLKKTTTIVFGLVPLGLTATCLFSINNEFSSPTVEWESAREYSLIAQGLSATGWLMEMFHIPFAGWLYFLSSSFLVEDVSKVYKAN